ncbi:MAG: hypothetical protein ACI4CX_02075, partial [Candidatus Weimeria sp.]
GADGDTYELNENKTDDGVVVQASDSSYIILKDLSLKYTRHDGYVTKVTTDIKLKIPQITASMPSQGFEHLILSGFSCVADKGLFLYDPYDHSQQASSQTGTVKGSIYAGSVYAHENSLIVTSGHKIIIGRTRKTSEDSAGNVTIDMDDSQRTDGQLNLTRREYDKTNNQDPDYSAGGIIVEKDGELWTQDINLNYNASLTSSDGSTIMVADDLNFNKGGSATIKGSYIGFGNGSTSDNSSSIVFNNSTNAMTKLDLSGAQSLMLAGRSFILPREKTEGEIGMGSSITTKGEQKAYLIPSGADGILGKIKNPQTVSKDDVDSNKEKVISLVNTALDNNETVYGMTEPLKKYNPTVKVLSYPISGGKYKQYYFFSFNSVAEANAYFKDFFNASSDNSTQIQSYINQYAEINGLKSSIARTAGTGLTTDNGDISITDAVSDTTEMNNACEKYKKQYKNLSETLNKNSSGDSTPFYSMIDVEKLHMTCGYKRTTNNPVIIAWWKDAQDLKPYDSEDTLYNKDGSRNLVVVDRIYDARGTKVLYSYQWDGSKTNLYKYTLESNGNDIRTKPQTGDKYLIIQDGNGVTIKENNSSVTTEDLQNIIGISNNYSIIDPKNVGQRAGIVAWTDEGSSIALDHDNDFNFAVVDGNAVLSNAGFDGLIMCSGNIVVQGGDINLDDDRGAKALSKTHIWAGNTGSSRKSSSEDWTLGKMVVYENWKKN